MMELNNLVETTPYTSFWRYMATQSEQITHMLELEPSEIESIYHRSKLVDKHKSTIRSPKKTL